MPLLFSTCKLLKLPSLILVLFLYNSNLKFSSNKPSVISILVNVISYIISLSVGLLSAPFTVKLAIAECCSISLALIGKNKSLVILLSPTYITLILAVVKDALILLDI